MCHILHVYMVECGAGGLVARYCETKVPASRGDRRTSPHFRPPETSEEMQHPVRHTQSEQSNPKPTMQAGRTEAVGASQRAKHACKPHRSIDGRQPG